MTFHIPPVLEANCDTLERRAWLAGLPETIRSLRNRWSLTVGAPFDGEDVTASWVAPVVGADGRAAVLKLGLPHMEAEHEIDGLRFWDGDPTVRLIEADDELNAMLLERCEPGTPLRALPEPEQDEVIAGLLRRLWRAPPAGHPFRQLSTMLEHWRDETLEDADLWPDAGLVREGLRLFEELPRSSPTDVLLATDLHAGNVLGARREPWLVIDPKPFVGDRAYDATQHLLNCKDRLRADPGGLVQRFAYLLGLDHVRVRLWTFARVAAEPRDSWEDGSMTLARALAP